MELITNLISTIYTQYNDDCLVEPKVVPVKAKGFGCGTGFFIEEDLVVTNIHCIAGASSVSVKPLDSNTEYHVEGVKGFDAKNDLVILKVAGKATPYPIGDSDLVKIGEFAKAFGCIDGKCVAAEGTMHGTLNNEQWLQTTAKTVDGYSGGPLLNSKGQVIGINFGSGNYDSTAISSNILKDLLAQKRPIEPLAQWQKKEQIRAYDYLVKSKGKIQTKIYDDAITDLDKTIQLNPDYIVAYENRGTTKGKLAESKHEEGNLTEAEQLLLDAIDDFTRTIRLCPDWTRVYNNRGTAKSRIGKSKTIDGDLSEAQKFLSDAIDDFTEVIRLCPDYAPAYNNRADAKLHLAKSEADSGNIEQSQELYQDAMTNINIAIQKHAHIPIEEDTNTALFHHTRGEIKEAMGDLHGVIEDFKNVIKNTEYTKNSTVSIDLERVKDALTKQG